MKTFIQLFSNEKGEIYRFLECFYGSSNPTFSDSTSILEWKKTFDNPVEMAEMVGVFIDNIDHFNINLWACLDPDVLINVTEHNVDGFIRYLYERFPH